jgi:acyl-CoA synthetase (NDP forming)
MADDAEAAGLDVKPMPETAQAELKAMLPYASPRNPVDATAQAVTDLPLMTSFISAMLEKGDFGFFAGIFGSGPASPTFSGKLRQALETAAASASDTIMALTMTAPEEIVRSYEDKGFIVNQDGSALMKALGAMVHFRDSFDRAESIADRSALPPPADLGTGALSELAAKRILAKAGVPFPTDRLVPPGGDIRSAADSVGYPQVLKIVSADIAHKTEIGGVIVGVRDADEAQRAFATILSRAQEKRPDALIDGVMVAPMISGGVETIAGVVSDPVFGPVVMFGLGGVFVEVLKDVTFRVAPFGIDEAHRMIREIRGYTMLEGVRGAPPSDVDALAETLAALSRFAAANAAQIDSVDLNPLRVLEEGKGVVALDALIVPRGAKTEAH